jgi:glycosyltransferase involved in cell wall biosynthesis
LIEAQACGCPVIASTSTSIPEVAGDAALYADAHDVASFAAHVRALEESSLRLRLKYNAMINLRRYDYDMIKSAYIHSALKIAKP